GASSVVDAGGAPAAAGGAAARAARASQAAPRGAVGVRQGGGSGRVVGGRCEDQTMLFAEVVAASAAVGATRARTAKAAALAALLRAATPAEVAPATAWLAGETRQGRVGTGWRTLSGIDAPPAAGPTLTVEAVDTALDAL